MTNRLARGFYHCDLSGAEAEKLLQQTETPGCFLIRPSRTKSDAYVLCVRRANGEITHIRIQRTNEGFDLGDRQDSFSTLYDMIDHYRRNVGELREKNNEIIELTTPILAQMPTREKYYYGSISHVQVVALLSKSQQSGTFLVRDSETSPGDYVICVKTQDDIANVKIKHLNGQWFLDGKGRREQIDRFKSLDDLIHFYLKHNILVALNGAAFRLVEPCISTWFRARDIVQRCEYLSKIVPSQNGQKTGFSYEFELLNQYSESQLSVFHTKHGEKPENRTRNRFKNILPYDETRVILRDYLNTDYMNANRVRLFPQSIRKEYIATQGPLPSTINDFWHMVQQETVRCIVMITQEMEGFKNKCARYWPELHTTKQYGTVIVENTHETNYGLIQNPNNTFRMPRGAPLTTQSSSGERRLNEENCCYRLRVLRIMTEDRRTWYIYHWQYLAWGDHDSPLLSNQRNNTQLDILLEFFENIFHSNPITNDTNNSPIVVHCSAGIGRSGATIAIDILLNKIRFEGLDIEIDVADIVKLIRSQRSGLVQTERQYELIYRVVEHFVEKSLLQMENSNKKL